MWEKKKKKNPEKEGLKKERNIEARKKKVIAGEPVTKFQSLMEIEVLILKSKNKSKEENNNKLFVDGHRPSYKNKLLMEVKRFRIQVP